MKKEDLLKDEFLKQFKNAKELENFLRSLHKRGIEKMLEGEIDAHLNYDKNQKSSNPNYRNGTSTKKIKIEFGETQIRVPRDRDATFEPQMVPKRSSFAKGTESLVISFYVKGMSNFDIEDVAH